METQRKKILGQGQFLYEIFLFNLIFKYNDVTVWVASKNSLSLKVKDSYIQTLVEDRYKLDFQGKKMSTL